MLKLKRDQYRLKMEDGANLMEHLNVIKGLLDQLGPIDVKVEEEDQKLLLLVGPKAYHSSFDDDQLM